jgi:hypothetical protein
LSCLSVLKKLAQERPVTLGVVMEIKADIQCSAPQQPEERFYLNAISNIHYYNTAAPLRLDRLGGKL